MTILGVGLKNGRIRSSIWLRGWLLYCCAYCWWCIFTWFLLCDANDSTCRPGSSVASGLAQLVTTLAQVVHLGVHHHSPPQDAVLPGQADHGVRDVNLGSSISSSHVTKVSSMTRSFGIFWSTMLASIRVEVRTSTGAAVGVVSKLLKKSLSVISSPSSSPP